MTKSSALKKTVNNKKSTTKAATSKIAKKPTLEMVKSSDTVRSASKSAKKPALKAVKPSTAKSAKKPAKAVAKKVTSKKAPVASSAKKAAVKKPIAKPITLPAKGDALKVVKPASGNGATQAVPVVRKEKTEKKSEFKVGSHVVYPSHGVGKIIAEETQEIGGMTLRMFVITFEKDKMTLRVPMHRAEAAGLRHISGSSQMQRMYDTLKGRAKTSRGMWSRRAQEYETKINSGNVLLIAEVVRDLHHNVDQAERSYSERMIYESAFNRLAGELAAAEALELKFAGDKLLKFLRSNNKKAA